jgi:hypothetical protein
MKRIIILTMCWLIALGMTVPATGLYGQDNPDDKSPTDQEVYYRLLNKLIDRGMDPERARQMVEAVLAQIEREQLEERRIQAEQNKPIKLTAPADIAFKHAMDQDLSYGVGQGRTQMGAVGAWEEVLKRKDISDEQRLFATWRMASLYAYNFDPERGEHHYPENSKKLFKEVLNLIPDVLSEETINAATQYASQRGAKIEMAERKAEAYRFLKTATEQMQTKSAGRINKYGYALDKRFFSGIARLPDPDVVEKTKWLNMRMHQGRDTIERSITAFLRNCNDEVAALRLLNRLEEFADAEDMEKWRAVVRGLHPTWATHLASLEVLEGLNRRPADAVKRTDHNLGTGRSHVQGLNPSPAEASGATRGWNIGRVAVPVLLVVLSLGGVAVLLRKRLLVGGKK